MSKEEMTAPEDREIAIKIACRRTIYADIVPLIIEALSEARRRERVKVLDDMSHRVHQILGGYPEFTHDDLIKIKSLIRDELDKLKQEGK